MDAVASVVTSLLLIRRVNRKEGVNAGDRKDMRRMVELVCLLRWRQWRQWRHPDAFDQPWAAGRRARTSDRRITRPQIGCCRRSEPLRPWRVPTCRSRTWECRAAQGDRECAGTPLERLSHRPTATRWRLMAPQGKPRSPPDRRMLPLLSSWDRARPCWARRP